MAIEIDPAALRSRAGSLRTIANDMDSTRSQILSALAMIGSYSPSTAALSGVVTALRSRALDLEYRASFVERLQPIALVATAPSWSPQSYDAFLDESIADVDLLIADLNDRIANWHGTDNDPILDEMIATRSALEASHRARTAVALSQLEQEIADLEEIAAYVNVSALITEKRAELADLTASKTDQLREALATLQDLEEIPYGGSPEIAQLYAEAQAEVQALQTELGVTSEDFRAAVAAMQEGMTPAEAGLSPLLFDPAYLEATQQVFDAQAEVARLEAELAHVMWKAENEVPAGPAENRLLESFMLQDAIEEAQAGVEDARVAIAPAIGDLSAWIAGFDLIRSGDGDAIFAQTLMDAIHPGNEAALDPVLLAEGLGAVDPAAAGAFFNLYGVYGVSLLPWHVMARFEGEGFGAGVPTLEAISVALADAQRAGHLEFTGAALMEQQPAGGMTPHLLRYGDYTPRFIAEAGAVLIAQGDDHVMAFQQTNFWRSLAEEGSFDIWDPRSIVLARAAEDASASLRLVELVAGNGDLRRLIDPDVSYFYDGEGAPAGAVLVHVGVAAANEDQGGRFTDLLAQVIVTTSEVDKTQVGVTNGLTTMLLPHLESFIPYTASNSYNGYFRDLEDTALNDALAALGYNSTATFRSVFDTLNESGSSEVLGETIQAWVIAKLYELHEVGGVEAIAPYSDELGGLMGLYADSAFDLDLADARDRDQLNGWIRTGIRVITTVSMVTATGGPMKIAELGLKKWAARQIVQGGVSAGAAALFPIDNAEGVLVDQVNAVHGDLSGANLLFIDLQGPDFFDPPYPFVTTDGAPYLPASLNEFDAWKTDVIENGYDYSANVEHLEDVWLEIVKFVNAEG